jgi:RNA polymerase sigma factor (sigma-70 family)
MSATADLAMEREQDARIADALARERPRLRQWLRRHVDAGDVEDVLQDVFYELVLAYRLARPIEQVGAWLFRVTRNRVIDLFRRRGTEARAEPPRALADDAEPASWEELLPARDGGPDAVYARAVLLAEIDEALAELPEEQREVFLAHEVEGLTFREMAALSGVSINTLLARKRYAVLHLRRQLRALHDDFENP